MFEAVCGDGGGGRIADIRAPASAPKRGKNKGCVRDPCVWMPVRDGGIWGAFEKKQRPEKLDMRGFLG